MKIRLTQDASPPGAGTGEQKTEMKFLGVKAYMANLLTREIGKKKKLIPVYHRMSSDSLLQRMQHGGTQNANERLNSVVQVSQNCLKKSLGKSRIEAAAIMAIATFNEEASALSAVMERLWLETTVITVDAKRDEDQQRILKANVMTATVA